MTSALDAGGEIEPPLQLPAILDLKAAAPLAAALLARRGGDVMVGAGEVQRLGGQCLQVLLAAHASWCDDRHSICFVDPSSELLTALELFGAASALSFHQEETVT